MTTTIAETGMRRRVRAYVKLGKLSFYDYYLSALVVWTLLTPADRVLVRTPVVLILVSLGWVGVVAATVTFDDVTGYRDGSDERNYDPAQAVVRSRERKPLLDGHLTLGQALRFGWLMLLWAVVLLTITLAVAPHRPGWALGLTALVVVMSVQYSYGLRLSYHGGQELVMFLSTALTVVIPYGLLTGKVTGLVLVEGYLFGLWSLLVPMYSNINDAPGDRAAGRRNLMTLSPPGLYRVIVGLLSATEVLAVAVGIATTKGAAAWFLLLLAPVIAIRIGQIRVGLVQRNPLVARKLGIKAHRLGVVLVLAADLLISR